MRKPILTILLLLILTLLGVSHAWARLGVEASLGVREEYDDNIFLTSVDEESDFITTVNPGLALNWETRHFTLGLDYGFEFLFYRDHSEFDETSVGDTQRAKVEAEILPEKNFSLRILDEYKRVPIDLRRPSVESNPIVNKTNVNRFLLNPTYRLGKLPALQATLGYQYEKFSYDSPEGDDNDNHVLSLALARQMTDRLTMTMNAAQYFYQADNDDDFRRQSLQAGFVFKVGPRLTLRGDGGATRIDFKERDDETTGIWSAGADLQASSRLKVGLAFSEDFSVLVDDGLSKTRLAELTVAHVGKVRTDFSLFAREEDFRSVDRKDREAGGALVLRMPLRKRLDLRLHGRHSRLEFLPEDADVRRTSVGTALEYRRGRLTVALGYDHHESKADNDFDEYRNNVIYLTAKVTFWRSLTQYQESQIADEELPFTEQ